MSRKPTPARRLLPLYLTTLLVAAALPTAACAAPDPPPVEGREGGASTAASPDRAPGEAPASPDDAPAGRSDRRMAITVDDLPVAPPGRHTTAQQEEILEGLLAVLAEHDAPAIGFVNEKKLLVDGAVDPRRVAMLERWLDAGHALGNHGHSHLDLHDVDPERWMADVLRGERVTRPLVKEHGGELEWFRHPFLHTGRSVEVQRETAEFLAEHGYRIAPVTVDNNEYIYADAYANAWNRGDEELMERLGRDYVRYMLEMVEFHEGQSRKIVGELVPQSLLIHSYALNADWLDPLMDALEERGYRWITLEEAVEHPAYDRPAIGREGVHTGPGGITWLQRWAIAEGMDRSIFRGEPEVPDWVRELAAEGYGGTPAPVSTAAAETPPGTPTTSPPRPLVVDRVELRDLTSGVNGVTYELRVSLPHSYATGDARYPVVYTLDADYSFLLARNITDHLAERGHLEEVVVVGVGYRGQERGRTPSYRTNRTRDYTPTFVPDGGYGPRYQKHSGGAPEFLEALATEIVPFVDRHYRTRPGRRTLVGHSYGGLFASWTLLTRPGLFDGYVVVSPSLWYDDHLLLRLEEEYAREHDVLPGRAYLCVGSREGGSRIDMVGDLETFAERLRGRGYRGFALDSLVMDDETHNSIFPGCLSNGLRYVLEGR